MFGHHLKTALRFTLITVVIFGVAYPLLITGYAHLVTHDKAEGQLIQVQGATVGSRIIGQAFTSDRYFQRAAIGSWQRL